MLDTLLEFGAIFDWISPLIAMVLNRVNGPSHTFLISHDCGWSGYEIAGLLRRHGVKTWGLMIVDGLLMVSVRMAQARWAQYLLLRAGIPTAYGMVDKHVARQAHSAQRGGRARPSWQLGRWLDDLMDSLGL